MTNLELEITAWLATTIAGVGMGIFVLRDSHRNWSLARVEPSSLRFWIARAHYRRAILRLAVQIANFLAGALAAILPPPHPHPLRTAIAFILISVAVTMTIDSYLDWRLQQRILR